jgi:hypothetical protein
MTEEWGHWLSALLLLLHTFNWKSTNILIKSFSKPLSIMCQGLLFVYGHSLKKQVGLLIFLVVNVICNTAAHNIQSSFPWKAKPRLQAGSGIYQGVQHPAQQRPKPAAPITVIFQAMPS